jgi:YidC/Oxa1 family membrane protein insertase
MVLCLFIFLGWMWLSQKIWPAPPPAPPKKPDAAAPATKPTPDKPDVAKPDVAKPAPETVNQPEPPRYAEKPTFTLRSKFIEATLTNVGAGVRQLSVNYPKPGELVSVLPAFDPKIPHLAVRQVDGPDAIESLPWEIVEQKDDRAEFRYRLRNGVQISKVFTIDSERNTLVMTLMLDNQNAPPAGKTEPDYVPVKLDLISINGLHPDSFYRYEAYLMGVSFYDHALRQLPLPKVVDGEKKLAEALKMPAGKERDDEVKKIEEDYFRVSGGKKEWMGVKNRFFTSILQPDKDALDALDYYAFRQASAAATKAMDVERHEQAHVDPAKSMGPDPHNIMTVARSNQIDVGKSQKRMQFTVYNGPLDKASLRNSGIPGADELGGYTGGCFLGFIVKPAAALILEMLHLTSKILHNMGLGIIITTLLIRLCLFPLSLKSQRSALQMQALAPKIQALKERYKDDQQKYGVEQMRLFKEHKVNPVAGCLPLFIQMPIFVGMYSVFEMSIDLRRAPFFAWIKDLSEPDRLFGGHWGIVIPLPLIPNLEIAAFNLLPILMMITWFLQAYLAPRSPDPQLAQQQKMMMWMPIVFGLSCYGLASGLSLYFLSNTLLSMAEQKIIKKYILKVPPGGPGTAPSPGIEKK